ncbi:MAG: hypothetical protein AABZ44_06285 [Elusimicrobiota bacterium]
MGKVTDHKIQIYLDDGLYKQALKKAQTEQHSLAAVVRESLAAYVARPTSTEINEGYAKLDSLVGFISDGPDIAENHDKYASEKDW